MPYDEEWVYPFRLIKQPDEGPERTYRPDLGRLSGYTGRLRCRLEAHTPLEVNYLKNANFNQAPLVPATSIKGVIRSMAELVGGGCLSVSDKRRNDGRWALCSNETCCVTCDLFGRLVHGRGGSINKGKVSLGEARPVIYDRHENLRVYQGRPQDRHDAFYPPSDGKTCYRKLYHHHVSAAKSLKLKNDDRRANDIFPVSAGSVFESIVDFEGIDNKQLALLAWCLELEPGLLHKMGRAKSQGLGSVKIRIVGIEVQDSRARLTGTKPLREWPREVESEIETIHADERLDEIRTMLSWESSRKLGKIRFPNHIWFQSHSQVRLRKVHEVLPPHESPGKDPELPKLAKNLVGQVTLHESVPIEEQRPDGFDEGLWRTIDTEAKQLVLRIVALGGKYKSDSGPFLRKYRDEATKATTKDAIGSAYVLLLSGEDDRWLQAKLGLAPSRKVPDKKTGETGRSVLEASLEKLLALENPKHLGKKIVNKGFKKLTDETEKKALAEAIEQYCLERGCPAQLAKLKDIQPYLSK